MDTPVRRYVAGCILEFPNERALRGFLDEMERIREAGDNPKEWVEDICSRYGGRVVEFGWAD